jgi:hypothetical protein
VHDLRKRLQVRFIRIRYGRLEVVHHDRQSPPLRVGPWFMSTSTGQPTSIPTEISSRKLFADASRRKYDLVLFWSLDRFSREGVLETLNHLRRLEAAGAGF